MQNTAQHHGEGSSFEVESLESRRLLSATWSTQDQFIGLDKAAQNYPNITGSGETVVLVDRGVDYNHPAIAGKVVAMFDFQDNTPDVFPYDGDAHGTGSAGQVAGNLREVNGQLYQGIAPGVSLICLKVNNTSDATQAFDWIVSHQQQYNIVAVNYVNPTGQVNGSAIVPELQTLRNSGVFVAGAIGNYGPGTGYGFTDHLIYEIGSEDSNGNLSYFSPRGSAIDMVAPGENVDITWYANGQSLDLNSSGTSWAGPQIVGAAALVKQVNSSFTPDQILGILRDSAHWVYDSSSNMSYPSLDVNAAISLAYQRSQPVVATPTPTPVPTPTPTPTPTPSPVPTPPSAQGQSNAATESPFLGTPFTTGQIIPAADYDNGGEGLAFHDLESANRGGDTFRSDNGVDMRWTAAEGGTEFVGWTQPGEWMNYTVTVPTAGYYTLTLRQASAGSGGAVHFNVDGKAATRAVNLPSTGDWDTYSTVDIGTVYLPAGQHTITLAIDSAGVSGFAANIASFRFDAGSTSSAAGGSSGPLAGSSTLTVAAASPSTLSLAWQPQDYNGLTVVLERSTGNGHWKKLRTLQSGKLKPGTVSSATYSDRGLSMGTSYHYRLLVTTSRGKTYGVDATGTTTTRHLHHRLGHRARAA